MQIFNEKDVNPGYYITYISQKVDGSVGREFYKIVHISEQSSNVKYCCLSLFKPRTNLSSDFYDAVIDKLFYVNSEGIIIDEVYTELDDLKEKYPEEFI